MSETGEVRKDTEGGLTTEQLADAGGATRAEAVSRRPASDQSARSDQAGQTEETRTDQGRAPSAGQRPAGQVRAGSPSLDSAASAAESDAAQLLDPSNREAMTNRWRDIQANFVDHPRQAMKDADTLVAGLMQQLAQTFAQERAQLEAQWSRGDQVSTEDLRVSLQRYRAFFERLLSV
jgi:hypothetical protein